MIFSYELLLFSNSDPNYIAATEGTLHHIADDLVIDGLIPLFPKFPIELNGEFVDQSSKAVKTTTAAENTATTTDPNLSPAEVKEAARKKRLKKLRGTPAPTPFSWRDPTMQCITMLEATPVEVYDDHAVRHFGSPTTAVTSWLRRITSWRNGSNFLVAGEYFYLFSILLLLYSTF